MGANAGYATGHQRFDSAQLNLSLGLLAEAPGFLRSVDGRALIQQLEIHLAPSMISMARRVGIRDSWIHTDDIVNSVIVGLCEEEGRVARRIAQDALDPWDYLAKCAAGWVRALWGSRGIPIESLESVESSEAPEWERLTPIRDVAHRTRALLAPYTEARLREALLPLLLWLAHNPPQRVSHELSDRVAAASQFKEFTPEQIAAVANIAWGSRPRRAETSLMAALLTNPDFLPSDSPSHSRALLNYRRAMRPRSLVADPSYFQDRLAA